ncbi:MAG: hypothetical protein JW860_13655 [Sedimentisphaerales bacterium]|nr:hypothetical protein [Sedimentisphaerales bacterium]
MLGKMVSFYKDCYLSDQGRKSIDDIRSGQVEYLHTVRDREQLITDVLPRVPLESGYAQKVLKKAYLYRKEKEIAYFSFLLLGRREAEEGRRDFICGPLLVTSARVFEEQGSYWLSLMPETMRVNDCLRYFLDDEEALDGKTIEELTAVFFRAQADRSYTARLDAILKELIPGIDCTEMVLFPNLYGKRKTDERIKAAEQKPVGSLKILPCAQVALIPQIEQSRGVLGELADMVEQNEYSGPLLELFAGQPSRPAERPGRGYIPSILSTAQEKVVHSACRYGNTLVIGPPGTGKSYTIASLAMEHLSKGESVLIASAKDHAVDVIADKISRQLQCAGCVVRGGKSGYLKDLKQFLMNLLGGVYDSSAVTKQSVKKMEGELAGLERQVHRLQRELERGSQKAVLQGELLTNSSDSAWWRLRTWWILKAVERSEPLWQVYERYQRILNQKIARTGAYLTNSYIFRLSEQLQKHRPVINKFYQAIRARTGGRQEDFFRMIDFDILLAIFPIWLVNLRDVYRVLPLRKELFDVAIIDEATQCDIASCLPILQRAKRVVITGDPYQLRHISFLAEKKQVELAGQYRIDDLEKYDYRRKSILDYFSDSLVRQENVIFLNEHYRSLPRIVSFSNRRFYGRQLNIMTEKPVPYDHHPISLVRCQGRREPDGTNRQEAEQVVAAVNEMINENLPFARSIGILSPFRKQADYIMTLLEKELSLAVFEKYQLLVGTAHAFQGEERDVMLLSLVIDNHSHPMCLRFLEREDVFNVSITRARQMQILFYSLDEQNLDGDSILREYLASQKEKDLSDMAPQAPARDEFARRVADELKQMGLEVFVGRNVAGITMDLCVVSGRECLGIDLIGYPGDFQPYYSIDRYRMFSRAGLEIMPLPYSNWVTDKNKCLDAITGRIRKTK